MVKINIGQKAEWVRPITIGELVGAHYLPWVRKNRRPSTAYD